MISISLCVFISTVLKQRGLQEIICFMLKGVCYLTSIENEDETVNGIAVTLTETVKNIDLKFLSMKVAAV